MKRIIKKLFTFSQYGEHYSIGEKTATWIALIVMAIMGTIIWTHNRDYKTLTLAIGIGYFCLTTIYVVTVGAYKKRIIELQKQLDSTTKTGEK
jgi:hypothetical protein